MVFNFICYLAWSRCLFHGDLKMIEVLLLLKDDFCFLLWHTVLHQWPFECAVSIERNHDQYRPAEIENSNDDGNQRQFPEKFLSVVDCQFASTASHPQFFFVLPKRSCVQWLSRRRATAPSVHCVHGIKDKLGYLIALFPDLISP